MNTLQSFDLTGRFSVIATTLKFSNYYGNCAVTGDDNGGVSFIGNSGSINSSHQGGLCIYSVNLNGNNTIFKNSKYSSLFNTDSLNNIDYLGGDAILAMSGGVTSSFNVPKPFDNGGVYFVNFSSFNPGSCDGAFHSIFSSPAQNLVLYEYIKSFPLNDFFYSTIGQFSNSEFVIKSQNYVGQGYGLDLVNRIGLNVSSCSPYISSLFSQTGADSLYKQKSSVISSTNIAVNGSPYWKFFSTEIEIIEPSEGANCSGIYGGGYVQNKNSFCFNPNQVQGFASFNLITQYFTSHGNTSVPGCSLYFGAAGMALVNSDNDYLLLSGIPQGYNIANAYLSNNGDLFVGTFNKISNPTFTVYYTNILNLLNGFIQNPKSMNAYSLSNLHRPVSIIKGGFIT